MAKRVRGDVVVPRLLPHVVDLLVDRRVVRVDGGLVADDVRLHLHDVAVLQVQVRAGVQVLRLVGDRVFGFLRDF